MIRFVSRLISRHAGRMPALAALALACALIFPAPGAAAGTSPSPAPGSLTPPALTIPTPGKLPPALEADLQLCRTKIQERLPGWYQYLNIGAGSVLGGLVGGLLGGLFGWTTIGASAGALYGGVVGYFGGNSANDAILQQMTAQCLRSRGHRI